MSDQADLNWFKSSYSSPQGDDCVEVATAPESVFVRDSKDTARSPLTLSPRAWSAFVAGLPGEAPR